MVKVSHSAPTGVNFPDVENKNCPLCKYPLFFPIGEDAGYATPRFVEIFENESEYGKEQQKRWTWQKAMTTDGGQYHRRCLVDECIKLNGGKYLDITWFRGPNEPLVLSASDKMAIMNDQNEWKLFDAKMETRTNMAVELPLFDVEEERKRQAAILWMLYNSGAGDELRQELIEENLKTKLQLSKARSELRKQEAKGNANLQNAQEAEEKVNDLQEKVRKQESALEALNKLLEQEREEARQDAQKVAERETARAKQAAEEKAEVDKDPVLKKLQEDIETYKRSGTSPFATQIELQLKAEEAARKKQEAEEEEARRKQEAEEEEARKKQKAEEEEEKRKRKNAKKRASEARRKEDEAWNKKAEEVRRAVAARKLEMEELKEKEEQEKLRALIEAAKLDIAEARKSPNEKMVEQLQKDLQEKFPNANVFKVDSNEQASSSSNSPGAADVPDPLEKPYADWMAQQKEDAALKSILTPLSTVEPHNFSLLLMEDPLNTNVETPDRLNQKEWYNYIILQSVKMERSEKKHSVVYTDTKDLFEFAASVTGSNGWWTRYANDQEKLKKYLNFRLATYVATMRDQQKRKDRIEKGKTPLALLQQPPPKAQWAKFKDVEEAIADVEKCSEKTTWFAELAFRCIFSVMTTPRDLRDFHMYIHTIPNHENGFSNFLTEFKDMLKPLDEHINKSGLAAVSTSLRSKVEDGGYWLKSAPLTTVNSEDRSEVVSDLKEREALTLETGISDQVVRNGLTRAELHFIIHAVFLNGFLDVDKRDWMPPEDSQAIQKTLNAGEKAVEGKVFDVFINRSDMVTMPHRDDTMFYGNDLALKMQPVSIAQLAIQKLYLTDAPAAEVLTKKLLETRWMRALQVISLPREYRIPTGLKLNCSIMANYTILRWVRYNLENDTFNTHLAGKLIPELLRALIFCNDYSALVMVLEALGEKILNRVRYKRGDKILSILGVAIVKRIECPVGAFSILAWYAQQAHEYVKIRREREASALLDSAFFPLSYPYIPSAGEAANVFLLLHFIRNENDDWVQRVMAHFNEEMEFTDPRSEEDKRAQKRPFDIHTRTVEGSYATVEVDGNTYAVMHRENLWFVEGINQMVLRNSADRNNKEALNDFTTFMVRVLPIAAHGFYNKLDLQEKGVPNIDDSNPLTKDAAVFFPWFYLEDNSESVYADPLNFVETLVYE